MRTHRLSLKISAIIAGIVVFALLLCWLLNTIFLRQYYFNSKTDSLIEVYEELDHKSATGGLYSDEYENTFIQICAGNNISVIIMSADGRVLLTSSNDKEMMMTRLLQAFLVNNGEESSVIRSTASYSIERQADEELDDEYLVLWGSLSDGNVILIRTAVASIEESASISNRFLFIVGIISLIIALIIAYFFTNRITEPVYELTDISRKMKDLDFDVRYESRNNPDEIDELGLHFNEMSDSLYSAISELKGANKRLELEIATKEENEKLKNEFLSAVSHELKTPISLVLGYAEGIKDMSEASAEIRNEYADIIIDEANKMNGMVRQLISINQLESGSLKADISRFNLTELIKSCLDDYKNYCISESILVQFDESDRFVWSDEFMTEQVIRNYITNAIHYAMNEKLIRIYYETDSDKLLVHVYNSGNNIPEEDLDHIWEKFYKTDKARSREYGGSGIGLSIVKAIMENLGEDYGVENVQTGVDFFFSLDIEKNSV